jgi:CubicO group peptidase (beta-lactamase class C family)
MKRREFLAGMMALALDRKKLDQANAAIEGAHEVSEAGWIVRRGGKTLASRNPETVFLIASITKPMTATAVMTLVDARKLSLEDPVRKFIPEFTGGDRDRVTLRHLLTHTSGLPDMLPENDDLRRRHAPLAEFVAATCRTPLLFAPGTEVRYQSMGILLAAEIAQRVTGQPFREYLRQQVFLPLGMSGTSLGLGGRRIEDTARCQVVENPDWNWNSPYWRDLGAPWGGAHSTAADISRFLEAFLYPDGRVLKPETARLMTQNQTAGLNEPWGIAWMLKPGTFGHRCSPKTFGHHGLTGTISWADPETEVVCALLTTKREDQAHDGLLGRVSDLVSEATGPGSNASAHGGQK